MIKRILIAVFFIALLSSCMVKDGDSVVEVVKTSASADWKYTMQLRGFRSFTILTNQKFSPGDIIGLRKVGERDD